MCLYTENAKKNIQLYVTQYSYNEHSEPVQLCVWFSLTRSYVAENLTKPAKQLAGDYTN